MNSTLFDSSSNRNNLLSYKLSRFLAAAAIGVAIVATGPASLANAEELPAAPSERLEKFFKSPQFGYAVLSPDQKTLAVTNAVNGRMHLAVVDLDTRAVTPVTGFTDADVWGIRWINNNRMIFTLADRESDHHSAEGGQGLFAVNRDGSKLLELVPTPRKQIDRAKMGMNGRFRYLTPVDVYPDGSDDVLVMEKNYGVGTEFGLFRLNTLTGRKTEFSYGVSGSPTDFITDNKQQLRIVVTRGQGEKTDIVWYRESPDAPWKKLAERDSLDPAFEIRGFDADNQTLYVQSRAGGDKAGIYKYDFAANKVGAKITDDPSVDISGLVFEPKTHRLLGVYVPSEPPHVQWLDPEYAAIQDIVDSVYSDRVNVITGNPKTRILIASYSAKHPVEFSLYDPAKKKLEHLFKSMSWIKPDQMVDQLIFDYNARDGLHIPAYLSVPKDKPLKALPMVVLVHGGPWMRDHWGLDPTVQFLADLGYVVLQPEYRSSVGYGRNHFVKGWKQWGLSMQDDVTDGVKNLVAQGIVDPKRVCIMGFSYGGYATLMGLIKDPELYRCGIDLFGPSDLSLLFTEGRWAGDDTMKFGHKELIGDPADMKAQFDATAPVLHADRIRSPLLMIYGAQDTRVPLVHGERMRDAMKAKGKTYEWMELKDEEHGLTKQENRYKVYGAIEKFLKTYNPAD